MKKAEEARLLNGLLGFDVRLEDWPAAKGMEKQELLSKFEKGFWWAVEEILEVWELVCLRCVGDVMG